MSCPDNVKEPRKLHALQDAVMEFAMAPEEPQLISCVCVCLCVCVQVRALSVPWYLGAGSPACAAGCPHGACHGP